MLDQLKTDLRQAQLARDEVKVSTLRLLLSEIKNAEIAKGGSLSSEDLISVISKEAKKRKEAAAGFRSGSREEQAQKEEAELKILEGYLPQKLSNEELTKIVEESISEACKLKLVKELGGLTPSDMGMIMKMVMGKVAGRADGGQVSALVKEKLS